MGLGVAGLAVFGLSALFILLLNWMGGGTEPTSVEEMTVILEALAGFSLGAESIALFARVGGGIYTKAADVGADLVGKVEAGIPEDDPRNPAPSPTTSATTWVMWPAWAPTCLARTSPQCWQPWCLATM